MFGNRSYSNTDAGRLARGDPARPWGVGRSVVSVVMAASLVAWTFLLTTPSPAYGAELRQGDVVVVPAGETIEDDLYVFGQTVTIHGTVNGDVIAAGQSVTIDGTVTGDVMAVGGSIGVYGPVGGAARLAGQTVEIAAPIEHDLLAGAATLNIGPRAAIGRDLLAGGSSLVIGGPVARSVRAGAESLLLGSTVGGDVLAQVGTLRLTSDASIEGSLSYGSTQDAIIDPGARIGGMVTRLETPAAPAEPSPAARFGELALSWVRTLVGLSILGLALVLLFPGYMLRSTEMLVASPWASLGLGGGLMVGVPMASLLVFGVGLLIGGWWLGPALLALSLMMLPVSCAIIGLFLGRLIMLRAGRPGVASGWSLVLGLAVLGVVSLVPVAGGIAILAALMFGLGAGVMTLVATYREPAVMAGSPSTPDDAGRQFGEPIPAR